MPNPRRKPEVLAPAGDEASLRAALASGADAVYFGLDDGFNARARATNFSLAGLPETVAFIHRAGARAYVTLNTLVFEPELPRVAEIIAAVARSGVDAIIVQDPAVALLARAVCPELEVHGSTQMTIATGRAAEFARALGVTRVVVPRELSLDEIRDFSSSTDLELEVFVHGALCVSWSGQCLTSEAWGGRSANRGQCAQSCRMPYDLIVDGEAKDLGDVRYLLSPKDLTGARAIPELIAIGVHGLKIEGRQKGPQYVATAVAGYRRWVDASADGAASADAEATLRDDLGRMALSYTRGGSDGFFAGSDHQTLVEGRFPKHRGVYLGRVSKVTGDDVHVVPDAEGRPWTGALAAGEPRTSPVGKTRVSLPLLGGSAEAASGPRLAEVDVRPGMGVVFDDGHPEDPDEPGGPVFRAERRPDGFVLGFGRPGPDLSRVAPGQRVFVTQDPAITRSVEKLVAAGPREILPLRLEVEGTAGKKLVVRAYAGAHGSVAESATDLAPSRGRGLDEALCEEKLGSLGGTAFRLEALDARALSPGLHLPVSELKTIRRTLVDALTAKVSSAPPRSIAAGDVLERVRRDAENGVEPSDAPPRLVALCRSTEQLEGAIEAGVEEVELDWMELVGLGRAVARAREAGLAVTVATLRVEKPGEEGIEEQLARLRPDAILVRHWGALVRFQKESERPRLHGDFSLNVTNGITACHLLGQGLSTVTASFDLDETQLFALLAKAPASRIAVVLHHRIPTFHTEHCIYSHLLSHGRDHRTCGRPCEKHEIGLRDHLGHTHPVIVDAGCRNTVFNADPQSAARLYPALASRGVRRFRVDFVRESRADAQRILSAYLQLMAGRITPEIALRKVAARDQVGVSASTMRLLGA
jgi:U32 family peptidase